MMLKAPNRLHQSAKGCGFWPYVACLLMLFTGAWGCHKHRPARLYGAEQPLAAADYPAVLRTWSRSAKIYRNLENKLFVTATFHSPELRRAFAVRFPDLYGHGGKITRRELVDLTGGVEQHHNFFVSVYTPDNRWNDLAKNDSIWHLTLRGSSEVAVSAEEVVTIKVDENLKAVYPYINRFDKIYLVRFPLVDPMHRMVVDSTTTRFTVRMASSLGVAELVWDVGDSQDMDKSNPPGDPHEPDSPGKVSGPLPEMQPLSQDGVEAPAPATPGES